MTDITSHHIDTLWSKMTRIYGHKWLSNFGSRDDGTWLEGLRGLLPEELARGLRACLTRVDPWPPTLPEFRRLCAGVPDIDQAVTDIIKMVECGNTFKGDSFIDQLGQLVSYWDRKNLTTRDLTMRYATLYPMMLEKHYTQLMALPHDERKAICNGR